MTSSDITDAITMKKVARLAGVSVTTVSRMLTTPERVALATQQRIEEAMRQLGCNAYSLNRQNRPYQSNLLLLILSDIDDPVCVQIIRGIETECAQAGYLLLIIQYQPRQSQYQWIIDFIMSGKIVGIFLINSCLLTELTDKAQPLPPIVLIGESANHLSLPSVSIDNLMAAFEAAEYLYQLGHRYIGCIAGLKDNMTTHYRLQGYQRVLMRSHIRLPDAYLYYGDFSYQSGCQGMQLLMSLQPRPTAVICHNELMTIGALAQAKKMRLRVPHDVSLLGFDGLEMCRYCDPPLTNIKQPGDEMGKRAVSLLLALMRSQPIKQFTQLVQSELVIGESTAWFG